MHQTYYWNNGADKGSELFPTLHAYQQTTIAFVVQALIQSGSAVMQQVAETAWEYLSSETKMTSHERRFQRFAANERIDVEACWREFLEKVLLFWQNKRVTLILDMMPYTKEATIVYIGIVFQSRVLPLGWCVMPQQESWEEGQWQIVDRLFEQVAPLLKSSDCTLLADRGLSSLSLIKLCQKQHWHDVLRLKQEAWVRRSFRHYYRDWEQVKQIVKKEGQSWYGKVILWKEHHREIWLSACWEPGYEEPWFLLSDQKASHKRVTEYVMRMKVEATFQDTKSRGCLIECSRFTNRDHLHRWLFAVYLAIWWIAHLGSSCINHGHREQLDRKDRRDKGLLRIGRLWMKKILKEANGDLLRRSLHHAAARLAKCLPFHRRQARLCFSIYLC